jgi:hypothetical protein
MTPTRSISYMILTFHKYVTVLEPSLGNVNTWSSFYRSTTTFALIMVRIMATRGAMVELKWFPMHDNGAMLFNKAQRVLSDGRLWISPLHWEDVTVNFNETWRVDGLEEFTTGNFLLAESTGSRVIHCTERMTAGTHYHSHSTHPLTL